MPLLLVSERAHNNMTNLKDALEVLSEGSIELSNGLEEVTSAVGEIQQEATILYELFLKFPSLSHQAVSFPTGYSKHTQDRKSVV